MNIDAKIYLAGHNGLVGSALFRILVAKGYNNLLVKSREELDLTRQADVEDFFNQEKPEYVFLAAAKVGGIYANSRYPADFINQNLAIQQSVINASYANNVKRLLFLGSSCIYPRDCPQPIREEYLLTGPLEFTNRPYAIAKIAGIEQCWAYNRQYGTKYLAAMPTNLYGPGDNYDLTSSHVLPALIRKVHEAKVNGDREITVWGTGNPKREFLYVDDMADASVFLMNLPDKIFDGLLNSAEYPPIINIGCGNDVAIKDLVEVVKGVIGFSGKISWDTSKPDGTPRKLLDVSKLNKLGWRSKTDLMRGILLAYDEYDKKMC